MWWWRKFGGEADIGDQLNTNSDAYTSSSSISMGLAGGIADSPLRSAAAPISYRRRRGPRTHSTSPEPMSNAMTALGSDLIRFSPCKLPCPDLGISPFLLDPVNMDTLVQTPHPSPASAELYLKS